MCIYSVHLIFLRFCSSLEHIIELYTSPKLWFGEEKEDAQTLAYRKPCSNNIAQHEWDLNEIGHWSCCSSSPQLTKHLVENVRLIVTVVYRVPYRSVLPWVGHSSSISWPKSLRGIINILDRVIAADAIVRRPFVCVLHAIFVVCLVYPVALLSCFYFFFKSVVWLSHFW